MEHHLRTCIDKIKEVEEKKVRILSTNFVKICQVLFEGLFLSD